MSPIPAEATDIPDPKSARNPLFHRGLQKLWCSITGIAAAGRFSIVAIAEPVPPHGNGLCADIRLGDARLGHLFMPVGSPDGRLSLD